jgi:hypothetical protein
MTKKIKQEQPIEIPKPDKHPEVNPYNEPPEPLYPDENPDIVPDEDPFENPPPVEIPIPGEGP